MKIEQASSATISELWTKVEPSVKQSQSLEEAAQAVAGALHAQFEESVVLTRVYLTSSFDTLPETNKDFVQKLAESAEAIDDLKEGTPVLSLIGSHGQEADWCDRRKSKGHVGIPLISSAFVGAIPMISRMLGELGVPMDFLDSHDTGIIIENIGSAAGLFFVENAAESTDKEGRKIIAKQDFVANYSVKSVFGIGGAYDSGQLLVVVVFCRDEFSRTTAEHFLTLANLFQRQTNALVSGQHIFSNG
ncbi:MAG: hypothetical protein ACXACY_25550 [Candidatus Hodarchaeales archaeon]|jgi:hypothetical protein